MEMRRNKKRWVAAGVVCGVLGTGIAAGAEDPDTSWDFSFGINNRTRYEAQSQFRDSQDDSKNVIYNRLRLNADLSYEKSFRVFIEGLDAREWTFGAPERNKEDDVDLLQAYIEFPERLDSPVRVKLGRQTFSYGRKRILAAPTWGNTIRSFDAALISWTRGSWSSDVFYGHRVGYQTGFNEMIDDEKLTGLYNVLKLNEQTTLDLYAIRKEKPDHDRYTTGARLNKKWPCGFSADVEGAYQFGDMADNDINAYALACRLEQAFDAEWKPTLFLEGNLASGDPDPTDENSETFEPPYQTVHGPYGIMDFFRWQNLREVALGATLTPATGFKLKPEIHAYWLDEAADAWYNTSGKALKAANAANTDTYAGAELSVILSYEVNKHCSLQSGYSAFLCGDAADEFSNENTVHYGYVQIALKK